MTKSSLEWFFVINTSVQPVHGAIVTKQKLIISTGRIIISVNQKSFISGK